MEVTIIYTPDGPNEIQSAEARGEALHQVPSTMQSLQQDNYNQRCVVEDIIINKISTYLLVTELLLKKSRRKKKRQQFL